MNANFQVIGIDKEKFNHLFELNEQELSELGAIRQIVKNKFSLKPEKISCIIYDYAT